MVGIVGGALMSCAISRKVSAMMLPAFMASKVGNYIIFCDKHKNMYLLLSMTLILIQLLERKLSTKAGNVTGVHDENIRNLTEDQPTTTATSTTTTTTTTTLAVLDRKNRKKFTYHNMWH